MNLVEKAIIFATKAHAGQRRKIDDIPYILHPLEVATIIATMTKKEEVIVAGLLHDTLEDTNVTKNEILKEFGPYVFELVCSETENKTKTEDKTKTWQRRKEESIEELKHTPNIYVKILWLADKISNLRSMQRNYDMYGDKMWSFFNQSDPKMHKWYYEGVLDSIADLKDTSAYKEYVGLVNYLFGRY